MATLDLAFVKDWLNIPTLTTDYDAKITALLPVVTEDYLVVRNAPWEIDPDTVDGDGEFVDVYPVGFEITCSEMIGYKLTPTSLAAFAPVENVGDIKSEKIGTYSVSYKDNATSQGYPKSITTGIRRYIRGV